MFIKAYLTGELQEVKRSSHVPCRSAVQAEYRGEGQVDEKRLPHRRRPTERLGMFNFDCRGELKWPDLQKLHPTWKTDLRSTNNIQNCVSYYSRGWPLPKVISAVNSRIQVISGVKSRIRDQLTELRNTIVASTRVGDSLGWPAEVKTSIGVETNELREQNLG